MLYVARKKAFCNVLGPGTRSVIWFYGCTKRCPGCIAETMNDADEYESYTPEQLAKWVLENNGIEGVTLSGGEPLEQPVDELTEFLTLVKRNTGLSVLCYTGYLTCPSENGQCKSQSHRATDPLVGFLRHGNREVLRRGLPDREQSNRLLRSSGYSSARLLLSRACFRFTGCQHSI